MSEYWFENRSIGNHSIFIMLAKCVGCGKVMSVHEEKESYICVPCADPPNKYLTTNELIDRYNSRRKKFHAS